MVEIIQWQRNITNRSVNILLSNDIIDFYEYIFLNDDYWNMFSTKVFHIEEYKKSTNNRLILGLLP